eukprot:TRINITY_DN6494_c0_g1_i1.p1 TRINITY_DN6494_c0_g1~~TRINITY_DN6494_c0_g1_i1.p1  ORF type:complete len:124 (-),score=18.63 TRINITY_DN6494_c0_g1_i1:138-509(-)
MNSSITKTILLLDCYDYNKYEEPVNYELKKKQKGQNTSIIKVQIKRTVLSRCVESIIEYCRILFDIHPQMITEITNQSKKKNENIKRPLISIILSSQDNFLGGKGSINSNDSNEEELRNNKSE